MNQVRTIKLSAKYSFEFRKMCYFCKKIVKYAEYNSTKLRDN